MSCQDEEAYCIHQMIFEPVLIQIEKSNNMKNFSFAYEKQKAMKHKLFCV